MLIGIASGIPLQYLITSGSYFRNIELFGLELSEHRLLGIYFLSVALSSLIAFKITNYVNHKMRFESCLIYTAITN